jgi:hypothetical protein
MRVDLPSDGQITDTAAQTALSIRGTGGHAIDWVAWVEDPDETARDAVSSAGFLRELSCAVQMLGIEVGANLSTNGRMWWSHSCLEPGCCPSQATALDAAVMNAVRAEFVYAGYAPLSSREDLAARIARDDEQAGEVARAMQRRRRPQSTQRWRDAQVAFLTRVLLPRAACGLASVPLSTSERVRVIRALEDIRVRDVVLHRLIVRGHHCDRCWEATIERLCGVIRSAPAGSGAAVATLLGLVAWMRGGGALATLSIQRALVEDPDYRLARLARELMTAGCDPRAWRATLAELPESECRSPGRP